MPELPEGIILRGTSTGPAGRSTVATRVFQPGEVIATFDSPSIAIVDSPFLSTSCSGCLLPAVASTPSASPVRVVRVCTGCRTVAYCSPACQRLDWTTGGHKGECKVFKRVRAEGHDCLPTPVRALLQVLLRPEMGVAMAELQGHVDRFRRESTQLWADMELQAMGALHYLGRETNVRSLAEAIEILCKLQVNSFSRLDEDVQETGLFMHPTLAMVNHSCTPNAFVQFVGRKAVLHTYQSINLDEEITISYIDCNLHLSRRQDTIKKRYHFTCGCPRCKSDLNIYQVCQKYSHLQLNSLSLAPGTQDLQAISIPLLQNGNESVSVLVEEIYPWCSEPLLNSSQIEIQKKIRRRWKACGPLRDARAYAIEPLPRVLIDASIYFAEKGRYQCSLCIHSFLATKINPYKSAAPFAPQRVKGLLMIARLLAHVAAGLNSSSGGIDSSLEIRDKKLREGILKALRKMDTVTACQVLLELVAHYAPAAHSREWSVAKEAREMVNDVEVLPGRETENALIRAFLRNPGGGEERRFFEQAVLAPIEELSTFCFGIMNTEFES